MGKSISGRQKRMLKEFIESLQDFRGRHTELVSVYVPAGYEMPKIINHLSQEQGTATNIKSAATRKNVIDALERMIQHLRLFKKTPPNGLAVFSGNVAEREGQSDVQVWSIEPPIPTNQRLYRCDKQFVLDILEKMMEVKEVYGLIVMDRREGDIAELRGKAIIPLATTKSNVPGKTKAGGQSAARYMRLREDAAKDFYKKIGEMVKDQFLGKENIKGIIVGGPGPTKYDFVEGNFITNDVKKKIIGIKDLSYTGEFGLQELVDKSEDILAEEELVDEKKLMAKFLTTLATDAMKVAYGKEAVIKALEMGAVETLLLSEDLEDAIVKDLEKKAEETSADVQLISTDTREGVQLREIGRIAAILRFSVG